MSVLFIEALEESQREAFRKLSAFSDDFILAGGTAIMLQINHRKSYDLDCFSENPLSPKLLAKARQAFGNDISVQVDNSDLLLLTTSGEVKVDFVYFPFKPLYNTVKSEPIALYNLKDLASNKAYTIGRRATWRDYVDMFFLMKKYSLENIIKYANEKFKGQFSEKLFLEQLVYYKDIDTVPIKFLQKEYSSEEIKNFLSEKVQKFTSAKIR